MRPRLAFYGSTPAYKVVLDAHGWGDLQPELNRLSKTGDWATMAALITDEIVDTFVVVGHARSRSRPRVQERYGDIVAAGLVRHPRPASAPTSSPESWTASSQAAARSANASRSSVSAGSLGHVVPRDVHDEPVRGLDRRDPPPVALPLQTIAVPFEPVALADDPQPRPRIVDSDSSPISNCGDRLRQRRFAGEPRELHLEPRFARPRLRVREHVADERRARPPTPNVLAQRGRSR